MLIVWKSKCGRMIHALAAAAPMNIEPAMSATGMLDKSSLAREPLSALRAPIKSRSRAAFIAASMALVS
jgi:hypothetical protein